MRWWRKRQESRLANRTLRAAFRTPAALAGTSLKPEHAGRCLILDYDVADGALRSLRFGILRHPRPYRFSRQHHEVIEYYTYDAASGRVTREGSVNVSRLEGGDGQPAGGRGPGV